MDDMAYKCLLLVEEDPQMITFAFEIHKRLYENRYMRLTK